MNDKNQLNPGKRENAFYIRSNIVDNDRVGEQSVKKKKMCVYVWDPVRKMHVKCIVSKGRFDTL